MLQLQMELTKRCNSQTKKIAYKSVLNARKSHKEWRYGELFGHLKKDDEQLYVFMPQISTS